MRNIFCKTIILSGLVLLFSCSQDPIFYTIKEEPEPIPPRIPGSPTSMAVFERNSVPIMYVASGILHWYAKTDSGASDWDLAEYDIPQPGGKIIGLAASKDYLYALSISGLGINTTLRRIGSDKNEWEIISIDESKYTLIQTIYTDPDTGHLFAGAMNNGDIDYGILYLDGAVLKLLQGDTEMLSGVVSHGGFYYLSTRGDNNSNRHRGGIFQIAETALAAGAVSDVSQLVELEPEKEANNNRLFMGMIKLEDGKIIAVERNGGAFFDVQEFGFKQIKYSNGDNVVTGKYATGVLALWQNVNNKNEKILVAGIQGGLYSNSSTTTTSYTHGYVEFVLNDDGSLNLESARRDLAPSITVNNYTDRYTSTIGKHPLNHMYQASESIDANMTFFASTQAAGLWSYRDRDGGWQWNAEK